MVQSSCLAGIAGDKVAMFGSVLRQAGRPALATISGLDVTELGKLHPTLVICDVDGLQIDPLETLRRLRFALPECTIVVYTGLLERTWGIACHLAGANCVLSKESSGTELSSRLRGAMRNGCYTDPRLARA
jgi:DNA-binding NarL/FixJ family response regulator